MRIINKKTNDVIPVEKGCSTEMCSEKCREVIGYYVGGYFQPTNNPNQLEIFPNIKTQLTIFD